VPKSLYIACTQASGGKTTIAAGLCLALRDRGFTVGYFKPVGIASTPASGERLPPVDPDAGLVAELLGLDDELTDICPVVLDEDAVHDVFDPSGADSMSRVAAAYGRVRQGRDIVVCEGLGEIWQGRFLRASGADVVARLDLMTLLIGKFAGARLLDDVLYVKEALKQRLLGVLFNMVPESRLDLVRDQYVPLLAEAGVSSYGVLATNPRLAAVSVAELVTALGGVYLCGERHAQELVETYMIGAMNPAHALGYFRLTPHKAVIVGGDRTKIILSALETPTVAIVLTGSYLPEPTILARAEERGVALISVTGDTVTAADDLRRLFGRMRVRESAKIDLISRIIAESLDLDRLLTDLEG
jgi:BioD-like phosphotransacetylase family protein